VEDTQKTISRRLRHVKNSWRFAWRPKFMSVLMNVKEVAI